MIVQVAPKSLISSIESAQPGRWIMYHVGFLANDRHKSRAIQDVAKGVWKLYEQGKVTLVQRKLGSCMYEYHVVKLGWGWQAHENT